MAPQNTFDVVVVGAGTFGAWTASHLEKHKPRVALLDAYGAANARAEPRFSLAAKASVQHRTVY